jgi:predicted CopG family antitoxin
MHVYMCMNMGTKTISIKDEAYEVLLHEKAGNESFSDVILRIAKKSGKVADCFGTWKMSDKEEEAVWVELSKGWHLVQERMSNEVSR